MTSDDVMTKVCATIRERRPGCDARGIVDRCAWRSGWVATIDVTGRSGEAIGHHTEYGPTPGRAAANLATSLGVSIEGGER